MAAKWFTPVSARAVLAEVRPLAERMLRLARGLEKHPAEIGSDKRVDPQYLAMVHALRSTIAQLTRAGVKVQNPRTGRLDFPARRSGREVLLCWQVGEPSLVYWHEAVEIGDPRGGRREVDEFGPWEPAEEAEIADPAD